MGEMHVRIRARDDVFQAFNHKRARCEGAPRDALQRCGKAVDVFPLKQGCVHRFDRIGFVAKHVHVLRGFDQTGGIAKA